MTKPSWQKDPDLPQLPPRRPGFDAAPNTLVISPSLRSGRIETPRLIRRKIRGPRGDPVWGIAALPPPLPTERARDVEPLLKCRGIGWRVRHSNLFQEILGSLTRQKRKKKRYKSLRDCQSNAQNMSRGLLPSATSRSIGSLSSGLCLAWTRICHGVSCMQV